MFINALYWTQERCWGEIVRGKGLSFLWPFFYWGIAVCCFMVQLTIQFSSGMMANQLSRDFNLDAMSVAVLMGMVFYPNILLQIPAGMVTDRFGAKRVLSVGALVCATGAWGFAHAGGFYSACFFRVWMGSGFAFAFVAMAYLIANWMQRDSFALMFSIAEMIALSFTIFAMRYLAVVLPNSSWRDFIMGIMYLSLVLGALAALFIEDRPDYLEDSQDALSFADIFVQLKLFVKDIKMWANGIYSGLLFSCLSCFVAQWGPLFLSRATTVTLDEAATMCTSLTFGLIVSCPLLSWVLPKIQNIRLVLSLAALTTSILLSVVVMFPMMNLWFMQICLFLVGFFSVAYLTSFTIAHYYVRPGSKSTAIGFTNMLATIFGPMLSILIAGMIESHKVGENYVLEDYQYGMTLLPMAMFLAALICFLMPETHRPGLNDDI